MGNIKPGYFNQKPLIKAVTGLKKTIGIQDSCIQTNQVSILFLEEESKRCPDIDDFIKSLCKKYNISLGTRDFEYFKIIQYKSYILQTYNLVEPFFKKLNKNYRDYNNFEGVWKRKDGKKTLDPFNQLLENLPDHQSKLIKSYPEFRLIDYYRLIRNSVAHLQEDKKENKKSAKYFSDFINDKLDSFHKNYELEAPNEPDNISFSDFMLYTRAIKYFSNILNDICFPEIKSLVIFAQKDKQLQKNLLQSRNLNYQGALLKRINVLRSFFHKHFNIHHKELRDSFCKAYLEAEGTDYLDYLN